MNGEKVKGKGAEVEMGEVAREQAAAKEMFEGGSAVGLKTRTENE